MARATRAAWLMIRRYGDAAVIQVAMREDELLAKGDLDGMPAWLAIIRAIEHLQAKMPGEGEWCIEGPSGPGMPPQKVERPPVFLRRPLHPPTQGLGHGNSPTPPNA